VAPQGSFVRRAAVLQEAKEGWRAKDDKEGRPSSRRLYELGRLPRMAGAVVRFGWKVWA
jgi:hypothetical protein